MTIDPFGYPRWQTLTEEVIAQSNKIHAENVELKCLLREVLEADDSNVDTATTLPWEITERIRKLIHA